MFSLAYFWIFFVLLLVGMPVVFALMVAPGLSLVIDGRDGLFFSKLLSTLYNGMYSFPLMAVPFFILAGELMNTGGITRSIVQFSRAMIGHLRGGLAQVNILSSLLFAGLSGSAVADTSALGKMLIPAMQQNGYSRPFAAAITAASSVIGPIIPPSGIMILYAFVMNVSVAGLFLAGFAPGFMIAVGLMLLTAWLAKRNDYPVASRRATWNERSISFLETFPALLTPVLLLGGILSGIYTPTEAAAVAAAYALLASALVRTRLWRNFVKQTLRAYLHVGPILLYILLGFAGRLDLASFAAATAATIVAVEIVWRVALGPMTAARAELATAGGGVVLGKPDDGAFAREAADPDDPMDGLSVRKAITSTAARVPSVLMSTGVQSGVILLLVGAAVTFGWMVTVSGLAREAASTIQGISDNVYVLFFLVNLLLFVVGMFLDAGPAILILGPVLGPMFTQLGVDPLHFAIVMCVNVTVGLATPPMGLVLFVAASVSGEKLERIVKAILPFLAVEVGVIFLITFFPSLSMTLPALAGFARCPADATACQAIVGLFQGG